ncbi:MAG TPA: class E sortase [Actinomycetes bacterium]|nr:class E sortase [Actinomycetes bacterium]
MHTDAATRIRARARAATQPSSPARTLVRGTGEVLITLGVLVLLFAAYQLVYTNVQANRAAAKVTDQIQRQWAGQPDTGPATDDFAGVQDGGGFAFLHIPRLGTGWHKPIVQGVDPDDLARGVGHYPRSAMPGRIGNFAVAGHRATHGEPFRDLNRLSAGDVVVVEAAKNWYVYRIDNDGQLVMPSAVGVVLPVPNQPGAKPTERLITLTTCDPRWGSTHRLIYWGHLESVEPKSAGRPSVLSG